MCGLIWSQSISEKEFIWDAVVEEDDRKVKQRRRKKRGNPRFVPLTIPAVVEAQRNYGRARSGEYADHIAPEWETRARKEKKLRRAGRVHRRHHLTATKVEVFLLLIRLSIFNVLFTP